MQRQFTTISPTHVRGAKPIAWQSFREGQYVAVGWLGKLDLSNMSDEQIRQALETSQELNWKNGQTDLVRFVNHLRIGDLVAVNNTNHSLFGIGEIISDYEFSEGAHETGDPNDRYSHLRRVRWLTTNEMKAKDILRDGEKPWEPYGTVGKISPSVPEYVWRLLSEQVIEGLSESREAEQDEAGQFNSSSGQGFQSDPRKRKLLEQYSTQQAVEHYEGKGFRVTVVGKPYDLRCEVSGETLFVEVKGTELDGDFILLTRNEVEHSRKYPMELFVLSKIAISEIDGTLIASGGSKKILKPWKAEDAQLVPYAFLYQLR